MDSAELGASPATARAGGKSRPIVFAADAAYAMPLATALRSLAESDRGAWPLDIHILHHGINDILKDRILASLPIGSASIKWHPVDPSSFASKYGILPHISKITYARLLLTRLLPDIIGKVLYLDSDILVLSGLDRLWEVDLEGAPLAAVSDPLDGFIKSNKRGLEAVPRVKRYFNAGVLLIDLGKWRSERVSERAFEYLDRFPGSPFSDQDALNFACDGRWKELADEWNFQCEPAQSVATIPVEKKPAIVHFVANLKPWKPGSLSANASLYDAYRARTRFRRTIGEIADEELKRLGHRLLRRSAILRLAWSRAKPSLQRRIHALAGERGGDA